MRIIFCFIFWIFCSCNSRSSVDSSSDQDFCDTSSLNGILIFKADSADRLQYSMDILNEDRSLYGRIVSSGKSEPYLDRLKGNIRAYYPEYYIIHFDAAVKNDSFFCVRIGNEMKIIRSNSFLTLIHWPEYISKFYCITDKYNPLRISPQDTATAVNIKDYEELSFKCLEVKGDWIRVQCFADCEGCPEDNTIVAGWLRWRKDGVLLIKLRYSC